MPRILDPNGARGAVGATRPLRNIDFNYDYPEGMNLRPGFPLHDKLVSRIVRFAQDSYNRMSARHSSWREIDRVLKTYAYLPPVGGPKEKKGTDAQGDLNNSARRIIMPVSQVVLETLLTYFTTAFLQDPIFDYEGTGPEDVLGAKLMTAVIQQQNLRNALPLGLHTAWRDMFAYGVGYGSPIWHQEMGRTIQKQPTGFLDTLRAVFLQTGNERVTSDYQVLFEGNKLVNIDPYLALPDPNVSAHEVQEGEFFGWVDEATLTGLLRDEAAPGTELFNVKYIKELSRNGQLLSALHNQGNRNLRRDNPPRETTPVDVIWMYIDLFPRDWGLPGDDRPETWAFGVAGDKILVKAQRLNLAHGKIPVVCGAPEFDGYSAAPSSKLLSIEEMQMLIDFLYTSHVENIKRVLNDSIVYDPTLIYSKDLNDNRPGKKIRLRRRAWGKGGIKDNAIFQLEVRDVTQQNVQEALFLMEQIRGATGTQEGLAGQLAPRTSRISASEAQNVRMSGLARLERPAQMVSYQFMLPLARMMASNVQQFMEMETFVKATGELGRVLQEQFGIVPQRDRVPVTPMELIINYDVNIHDGAVPGRSDVGTLVEMFQSLAQNPQLAQQFDIVRIFEHIALESGVKNVHQFRRQAPVQVMPDEQVLAEADRGNIIPVGGDGAAF